MQNARRTTLIVLILLALVLSSCKQKTKEKPTQLDAAYQEAQRLTQQAPRPTRTPFPTEWPPTATRLPRPTPVSPTPWPTQDPNATEAVVENLSTGVPQGDWLLTPFTGEDGQQHTLQEYLGRAVVLETVSSSCSVCIEQQQNLLQAIRDRSDMHLLTDTVFIALGMVPGETPSLIKAAFQSQLGADWATVQMVQSADTPSDYIFAQASADLRQALQDTFGPGVIVPENVNVIVIEKTGITHLFPPGVVSFTDLRDAITAYGNPPPENQ